MGKVEAGEEPRVGNACSEDEMCKSTEGRNSAERTRAFSLAVPSEELRDRTGEGG